MKKIELKIVTINNEHGVITLDYRERFIAVLRYPVNGMTIDQIEVAIRLITKLKSNIENVISLEDDEWNLLSNTLKQAKWTLVCPELLEMIQSVIGATT